MGKDCEKGLWKQRVALIIKYKWAIVPKNKEDERMKIQKIVSGVLSVSMLAGMGTMSAFAADDTQ